MRLKNRLTAQILELILYWQDRIFSPIEYKGGARQCHSGVLIFSGRIGDFFIFLEACKIVKFRYSGLIIAPPTLELYVSKFFPDCEIIFCDLERTKFNIVYRWRKKLEIYPVLDRCGFMIFAKPDGTWVREGFFFPFFSKCLDFNFVDVLVSKRLLSHFNAANLKCQTLDRNNNHILYLKRFLQSLKSRPNTAVFFR